MSKSRDEKHYAKFFRPSKYFWLGLAAFAVAVEWAYFLNGPVGEPTTVQGNITQRCVSRGKQANRFHCIAQLRDGTLQQFTALHPVESGAPVLFSRYSRRFAGVTYEIKSY